MKIIHVEKGKEINITGLVTNIKWSGDYKQVARVLDFEIVTSTTDKNIPSVDIKLGDMVKLLDDNDKERFRGYVFIRDKSLTNDTIDFTCYDGLIYLTKSKGTYNFKSTTPGRITSKVCRDFNIPFGDGRNGRPINRIFDSESIYDIIMTAYTFESNRTKKKYIPVMDKGKLYIREKGEKIATFRLDYTETLIDASYGESMENSINVVKIYNDEGSYKGEVTLSGVPGRLQDVYTGSEGKAGARSLLQGIEKTASIDALGDFECVTGNTVYVEEKHTGLIGKFYIDTDEHEFSDGVHKMSLGLAFQNIMDSKEAGEDPDEIAKEEGETSSGGVTGTGKDRVWSFLKSKGCSDQAAAGIMGNLEQESGIDPSRKQSGGGPGRGIMQWTVGSNRFKGLQNMAKRRGTSWTNLDTQLEFMWYEIQNEKTAVSKLRRKYGMTPSQMMKITNVSRATRIFEDCYERAGKPNYARRERYAMNFYNKYKGSNVVSGGGSNKRALFISAAQSMIGWRYSQGRRMQNGYADCSSLVGRAMKKAGITNNAQLTTRSIVNDSRFRRINKRNATKGDILWEKGHVGIFMGGNRTLEARWSTKKVGYSSLGNRFTYAYRIKGI